MNPLSPATEAVVRRHLTAFLERRGVDAIVADYSEAAHFHTETDVYVGKQEIRGFFERFIEALPAGGIDRFELRTLHVEGDLAYITWNVGVDILLGTDTFHRRRWADRRPDLRHVRPAGPAGLTSAATTHARAGRSLPTHGRPTSLNHLDPNHLDPNHLDQTVSVGSEPGGPTRRNHDHHPHRVRPYPER